MKILVDQNLPIRLVPVLAAWPWAGEVVHTSSKGWGNAGDLFIWRACSSESWLILTKDKDFAMLSLTLGHPPKVVLLRRGNCSVLDVIANVSAHRDSIEAFARADAFGLLAIDRVA